MKEEARLLDVERYFDGGVYGALDDYKAFSKAILIQRIIDSAEARGDEFLGFGDGYVEIENVHRVGGVTVGVASDEPECRKVDEWKRDRLVNVGADLHHPQLRCHRRTAAPPSSPSNAHPAVTTASTAVPPNPAGPAPCPSEALPARTTQNPPRHQPPPATQPQCHPAIPF